MKKVIVYTHEIQHYRVPIFRILADTFEITIVTSIKPQTILYEKEPFYVIYSPLIKIGPFIIHKKNIHRLSSKFDVVIGLMNLRCLDIISLAFNPFLTAKVIFWGIGVSASYERNFDQNRKLDFLRAFLFRKADALIFYTNYPISKYIKLGFKRESLFVANNTVEVLETDEIKKNNKDKILFIGSLYPQKGIMDLLQSYYEAFKIMGDKLNKLHIIGDGPEFPRVKEFINERGLANYIKLEGAIFDQKKIRDFMLTTILCISPKQAGLSVLMSMGYAVCFLTQINAITGGEILNIENNETGLIYKEESDLIRYIVRVSKDPEFFIKIGQNAKEYYVKNRKPEHMAKGIENAIKFSIY